MMRTMFSAGRIDLKLWRQGLLPTLAVLSLAACATTETIQPPKQELDAAGNPIVQAGDIAIAGQLFSHSIMDLPEVADATKPPLVRFAHVTSIVTGPVDTTPYTTLLRDRLLLLTREKLRFVERQLPAFTTHKIKHRKELAGPIDVDTDADYEVTAQLRGAFDADTYLVDIRFMDLHSAQVLFDGDYRISKEQENAAQAATTIQTTSPDIEPTGPNPPQTNPIPEQNYAPGDGYPPPPPAPTDQAPNGNSGLQ